MPSRVVIINDRSVARGGATGLALLSARLLRQRGIAVTFITGDAGEGRDDLEQLGVEVVALDSAPLLDRGRWDALLSGLYNPNAFRLLRAWIDAHDGPRVIYHLHTWSRILSPSAFRALRPLAERLVVHAHDYFLTCPNGWSFDFQRQSTCERRPMSAGCLATHCDKRSYSQKLWRSARQVVRATLFDLHRSDANIVMVHPGMRARMERAGIAGQSLHTIRNPAEPFTHDRLFPAQQRRFFMIARLEEEKGFLDAAAAARQTNLPLTIVGEGPGRKLLEAQYPEVELLGWRSKAEIGAALSKARAVLMPTRGPEPFGLVAVEAITSGLPIILSDQAALAEEVEGGRFGLVYRDGVQGALASAMRRVADDDGLVAAMAHNACRDGHRLASTNRIWCDALLEHYRATLSRGAVAATRPFDAEEWAS